MSCPEGNASKHIRKTRIWMGLLFVGLVLGAGGCSRDGSSSGGGGGSPARSTVGGSVSGLTASGLVLRNNGGDDLSISANGSFTFATALANGSAYSVTVQTQPNGQNCSVSNGAGTVSGANVTNVAVACRALQVVFHSSRKLDGSDAANTNPTPNIWRVDADGTGLTPLTNATASGAGSLVPQWSPDGSKIVFHSSRKLDGSDAANTNFTSNIWRVNADGTGLTPLTNATASGAHSLYPQWSPDGSKIVFHSSRKLDGSDAANTNGTSNIWRVNADGTGLTPLTNATASGAHSFYPQFSH